MNAEAVITFNPDIAAVLQFTHKRAGHLSPKMRYMSAQLLAHLEDDLWRTNAVRANGNASRVLAALSACPGVEIAHPVHINEIFVLLPPALEAALVQVGLSLRPWDCDGKGHGVRMVMSYADEESHLELFEHTCRNFVKDCLTNTGGIVLP
jgi:threonine aldolase